MKKTYDFTWTFPLPRTHTGVLLGNGTLGAMVWGQGETLRITFGRADWWDHRGGSRWTPEKNFRTIRRLLEKGDAAGVTGLFAANRPKAGDPARPTIVPVGRLEIEFGPGTCLHKARLDIRTGILTVRVKHGNDVHRLRLLLDIDHPVLLAEFSRKLPVHQIRRLPAWEFLREILQPISYVAPVRFRSGNRSGWVQTTPADQALCLCLAQERRHLAVAVTLGEDGPRARHAAGDCLTVACGEGFAAVARRNRRWWKAFWRDVPGIAVPNRKLQFLYDYGLYKFATFTQPAGVPATLQGPWVEEYQMPPWSNDYHFNINVQMCYWPAYRGNRLDHLKPLFRMLHDWLPELRRNAKCFVGIDDGIMLPHAVDDRGTTIGSFWTGTIDHGCTAWVAQMMFHYYLYTQDRQFLRRTAFPFMRGAMRVYEAMLEADGTRLALPVSTSPEYKGAAMDAWGRNASFQLACVHMLGESLVRSAQVLGLAPEPAWEDIRERLPKASLCGPVGQERIGLWDGQDLDETHRHHSHLGGLCPFDVLDPADPEWKAVIERSIAHWIYRGPGLWSGWCVPWAAMLHLRLGNADWTELLLDILERVFTNEGHGTRHDGFVSGFTLMGVGPAGGAEAPGAPGTRRAEIMQMDAGMSAVAAIMEMMLHTRRGVNYLFAGAPAHWRKVSFGPMRTEGAFLVSAAREDGVVTGVRVTSLAGGVFRLANPWAPGVARIRQNAKVTEQSGEVLEVSTRRGGEFCLTGR